MLKIGIVGSGFGLYGLLPAFRSIEKCEVSCICGEKTVRLMKYCRKINLHNIYSDWKVMLEKENLDAIALAVPPNVQYEIAKVAINKGINIFAEKPLAVNYIQAKDLFNLAQRKKIIHVVDFIFPEIEEWQKIKEIIDKKTYGNLKHISVDWNFLSYGARNRILSWKTNPREGGGALSFYFSHTLHYLEYYAGEISTLKSLFSYPTKDKKDGEIGVDLIIKFKNGVNGNAHLYSGDRGLNRHQLILKFEKATIILENTKNVTENFTISINTLGKKEKLVVGKNDIIRKEEDERVRIVRKIGDRFIDACINKEATYPSFKEGLRVQKIIEEVRANKI